MKHHPDYTRLYARVLDDFINKRISTATFYRRVRVLKIAYNVDQIPAPRY